MSLLLLAAAAASPVYLECTWPYVNYKQEHGIGKVEMVLEEDKNLVTETSHPSGNSTRYPAAFARDKVTYGTYRIGYTRISRVDLSYVFEHPISKTRREGTCAIIEPPAPEERAF